jgi:hypothetical protein
MRRWRTLACVMAVVGLVLLSACQGGQSPPESATTTTSSAAPSTTTTVPEIIPGVASVLYEDTQYGFSLYRPESSAIHTQDFEGYLPLTQTPVVAIVLPAALFEGTNLGEAGVYVGASSSPAVTSSWNLPSAENGEISAGTVTLGGVSFAVFTSTGAAAGNIYEERIYRALRDGVCLEIVELLHSSNIGNYDPGTVVEFDKAKFQGYLEAIVRTFSVVSG